MALNGTKASITSSPQFNKFNNMQFANCTGVAKEDFDMLLCVVNNFRTVLLLYMQIYEINSASTVSYRFLEITLRQRQRKL